MSRPKARSRPRMRPSFTVESDCAPPALMDAFRHHLETFAAEVEGDFSSHHGVLRVPEADRRFWTPCLDLTIDDALEPATDPASGPSATPGATRTRLWGTYSPRAEVWTAFVFAIGTCVIVSIFGGIYGIAQLALGHWPSGLLVPIVAAALAAGLYGAALIGQGLSLAEMYRLRAFVDFCLREAEEASRASPATSAQSAQL